MCLEKFFLKILMPHSGHSTMSGLPAITSQVTSQHLSEFVPSAEAMGASVVLLEIDQSCKVLAAHVTLDTCPLGRVSPLHVSGHAPGMQPLPTLNTRNLPLPRPWKCHRQGQDHGPGSWVMGQHKLQPLAPYLHEQHTLSTTSAPATCSFVSPARLWSWSMV